MESGCNNMLYVYFTYILIYCILYTLFKIEQRRKNKDNTKANMCFYDVMFILNFLILLFILYNNYCIQRMVSMS